MMLCDACPRVGPTGRQLFSKTPKVRAQRSRSGERITMLVVAAPSATSFITLGLCRQLEFRSAYRRRSAHGRWLAEVLDALALGVSLQRPAHIWGRSRRLTRVHDRAGPPG
jgi:hypothetical protein